MSFHSQSRLDRSLQPCCHFGDVACTKADDHIACSKITRGNGGGNLNCEIVSPGRDCGLSVTTAFEPSDKRIGRNAVNRAFPGGVDRERDDRVGIVKRLLKIIHMLAEPGEAVRLDCSKHAPCPDPFARSGQDSADFDRMVRIIVDDRDNAVSDGNFANLGKAAFDPAKALEPGNDGIIRDAHMQRNGNRGERVLDIVTA